MKTKALLTVALGFVLLTANAQQNPDAMKYAKTITTDDLYDHLSILSSDALEGRETGERGQKMAAALIANHFRTLGLEAPVKMGTSNSYYQPVMLYTSVPGDVYVTVNGNKKKNFEEAMYLGNMTTNGEVTTEIVFLGRGNEADFQNKDVKGKAVLVMTDNMRASKAPQYAKAAGADMLFVVATSNDDDYNSMAAQYKGYFSGGRLSLEKPTKKGGGNAGTFVVSPSLAAEIFGTSFEKLNEAVENNKLKKIKPATITYHTEQAVKNVASENVLGYMEGTDKKDELIVITAHYDHIGRQGDDINNGADDDGSGTSSVMELAQAFAMAKADGKGPRRSILFMTVTGEEKGLLGSAYYANHPIWPLANTVANLNIDMIGRIDPPHEENPNYVYLVGADKISSELHTISEKANATYTKMDLDYTYNDENHPDRIYYRSDHWNFAKNGIPVIFYFNGIHADYHKPTDTIEKINFEMLAKRAHLVFYTAWELANRDGRIVVDKGETEK